MNAPAIAQRPVGAAPAVIDRVKRNLVGLKMPRALEILDVTLRGIERGEPERRISAWRSASRRSKPAAASTSALSPISSPRSRRPNAKACCARKSVTSVASRC